MQTSSTGPLSQYLEGNGTKGRGFSSQTPHDGVLSKREGVYHE